jgi:pimeloyl-ACP methyl ester carboxylesterase
MTIDSIHIDKLSVLRALPSRPVHSPILFVHGYFADATVFAPWLERFSARGWPSYAVNLRGRSDSRPHVDLGRASMDDFVADATAVARELGSPVVVGHSMGGLIAQRLAAEQLVRAAALLAPAPPRGISVLSPRLLLKQVKHLPAILSSRTVEPGHDDLRALVLNRVPREEQDRLLAHLRPDSGRAGREMSISGVAVDAASITCPMMVVAGEDDRFIPVQVAERIARRYRAPFHRLPAHAHMLIAEPGWERVADIVEDWLRTAL